MARIAGDELPILVPGIAVVPHFETFGHRWVDGASEAAPSDDVVLLGLDERTAAIWQDGVWTCLGAGGITIIRAGRRQRFASGDLLEDLPAPRAADPS